MDRDEVGRESQRERMRGTRENSKRMIGGILQDWWSKGKEGEQEVRRRVTRCYGGGRTSE